HHASGAALAWWSLPWWSVGSRLAYCPSHRPVQNRRPLDDGDGEEQQHQNTERERNRDRTVAAAALLRLGEDDPFILALIGDRSLMRPLPDQRRNGADDDLEQKRRKQREEIKDREGKHLPVGAERAAPLAADIDIDRKRQHAPAEDQRGDAVDPVEIAEW